MEDMVVGVATMGQGNDLGGLGSKIQLGGKRGRDTNEEDRIL